MARWIDHHPVEQVDTPTLLEWQPTGGVGGLVPGGTYTLTATHLTDLNGNAVTAGATFTHLNTTDQMLLLAYQPPTDTQPEAQSAYGLTTLFQGRTWHSDLWMYPYRARCYLPEAGVFAERDPEEYSDANNLYAALGWRPTGINDPFGDTLSIVLSFQTSLIPEDIKVPIAVGIRQRFTNAGVDSVNIYFAGSSAVPEERNIKPPYAIVFLYFNDQFLGEGVHGLNRQEAYSVTNKADITTFCAVSLQDPYRLSTYMINVGSDEAGQASRAMPQFDQDTVTSGGVEDSVIATNISTEQLADHIREFSHYQACLLQRYFNRPRPEEPRTRNDWKKFSGGTPTERRENGAR